MFGDPFKMEVLVITAKNYVEADIKVFFSPIQFYFFFFFFFFFCFFPFSGIVLRKA